MVCHELTPRVFCTPIPEFALWTCFDAVGAPGIASAVGTGFRVTNVIELQGLSSHSRSSESSLHLCSLHSAGFLLYLVFASMLHFVIREALA